MASNSKVVIVIGVVVTILMAILTGLGFPHPVFVLMTVLMGLIATSIFYFVYKNIQE